MTDTILVEMCKVKRTAAWRYFALALEMEYKDSFLMIYFLTMACGYELESIPYCG